MEENPLFDGDLIHSLHQQDRQSQTPSKMGFGKQKGKGAFQALLNLGGRKQVDLPNVIRPITIQSIWMNRPIYVNTLFSIEVGQKGLGSLP